MRNCTFELNDKPMSSFNIGASSFPAFSGLKPHVNQRMSACIPSQGPIPPGKYFILNRESGGKLGWFRDLWTGRRDWFALYADDGKIDDSTWCDQVVRGYFRFHPKGFNGISQGCIVIDSPGDFQHLSALLRGGNPEKIPNIELWAWGKVVVK